MDGLEKLLAHEEIRQLAARYALAVDSRDLDTLVGLFVEDVQVGRDARGRAALRASFETSLREVGVTVLNVGTHVIDLADETHAAGKVYCKAEVEHDGRWIHQAILYDDTYERRDVRWYFVRRKHLLWYGAPAGESPLGLPLANWPEHHEGIGTIPESWETWQRFWKREG
ncbi:MAG: nuclear transport factor 2 family protein [Actinomycetota bacterium]